MKLQRWISLAAALASPAFAASLELAIEPVFNGEPLRLDSLRYETSARETISVTRLSYLLSGFALEGEDGQWTEIPNAIAWLDSASRRHTVLLENIPPEKFRSIRFHIGPDALQNSADVTRFPAAHPLNPNLNGLHWTWQTGYIFMAIEGHYRNGNSAPKGYAHHLARDPNRTRISLGAPLDLSHDAGALIHFDIATLLNAPRPLSFEKDGSATHSREGDPIAAALVANLPGAFRVHRTGCCESSARHAHRPSGEVHTLSFHYEPDLSHPGSTARQSAHRGTCGAWRKTLPRKGALPRQHHLLRHLPPGGRRLHRQARSQPGH